VRPASLRFFSQADDGIRDRNVTGVQTCALPISALLASSVPVLVGGLIATSSQLRRARRDRVSQGGEMIAPSMPPEAGRAASSLLTAALPSESPGGEASDARRAVRSAAVRRGAR